MVEVVRTPRPVIVDFETMPIEDRPDYPPAPVGVAIRWPGKAPRYHAWGHPTKNNSGKDSAYRELKGAYAHPDGVCFHHAKFDLDVAEVHLGLKPPHWSRVHDTLFLLFLDDPHQRELGLKEAYARLSGEGTPERDAVVSWLVEHRGDELLPGHRLSDKPKSPYFAGAFVAHAPGDLVGRYACGDVRRTGWLFDHLHEKTLARGMGPAYDRERRLLPVVLEMERQGLRVDLPRLERDLAFYERVWRAVNHQLLKRLQTSEDQLNLDSGQQLIRWLVDHGQVADEDLVPRTAKGNLSSSGDALTQCVADPALAGLLRYRAGLKTTLGTYLRSWHTMASRSKGLIFTSWNQVRNAETGGELGGTRTGRMSCTWFMNMPKAFDPIFAHETPGGLDPSDPDRRRKLPACPFDDLPPLPLCRDYVVPYEKGDVLLDRDYAQQELKLLGHFEGGALKKRYLATPWMDAHDEARDHIERVFHRTFERTPIKNTNFGLIYGEGLGALAAKNGSTVEEAKEVKDMVLSIYPGLKEMFKADRRAAKDGVPIVTWGGREYYCEPTKIVNGRFMTFDYKLMNQRIQGSAADCTKEAMIRYAEAKPRHHRLLVQVHDQFLGSAPRSERQAAMELMRATMESLEVSVAMLTEGKMGMTWATLREYDVGPAAYAKLRKAGRHKGVICRR